MTYRQLETFIQTRLDPLLHKGYYSSILSPDGDSIKSKKIRDSFLIFRSANKASSLEGADIDYLSLDEYDRITKGAEASAIEAMSSSKFSVLRRWSTPLTPNTGVDELFGLSDKKKYLHKCSHCNHWNDLTYGDVDEGLGNIKCINPEGVHEDTREVEDGSFIFVCSACQKPLDRWYNGQWVAERPDATGISGYLITQLSAVWISADELKRKEINSKTKQTFHNYILGVPFQDASLSLVDSDVMNHRRVYHKKRLQNRGNYTQITVGIDWGKRHWVTIHGRLPDGKEDLINVFSVRESAGFKDSIDSDVKEIIERVRLYEPDLIVADIGYNGNRINHLVSAFGKKVFGVQVNPAKSNGQVDAIWNDGSQRVSIDKLTQNKIMLEKIKTGHFGFWQEPDAELRMYTDHWKNVVIRDEENERTGEIEKIITRKGDDHYSQSSVYANIAMARLTTSLTVSKNSFGYTEVDQRDVQNMNDTFNDILRRP